jgi:hypothetical protein
MRINFTPRTLLTRLAVFALIAAYLVQVPTRHNTTRAVAAQSFNTGDDGLISFRDLNSIGLVPGDSLVATLFNAAVPGQSAGQPTLGEPITWTYTVSTVSGNVILERSVDVLANQFRSIVVTYDELTIDGESDTGRKQVGLRNQLRTPPLWGLRQRAVATLELVDSAGRTRVAITDGTSNTIFFSSGIGGGAWLVGVAPGQSLRLSADNADEPDAGGTRTETISMQVKAYDKDGNVIGGSDTVAIPPGQFRTVRLDFGDLVTPGEGGSGRKQVRMQMFLFTTSSPPRLIPISLEIVQAEGSTAVGIGRWETSLSTILNTPE